MASPWVQPSRCNTGQVNLQKMVERQRCNQARTVIEAERLRQYALDQELQEVQRQIDRAVSTEPAESPPKAASPKAASPRPESQPVQQPVPQPAPHAAAVQRIARRQRLKKRPLRVRTPTDILMEQVATTPALQYWWPEGGLSGVHAIDSSEDPVVRVQGSARFHIGAAHRQGARQTMEDRSVVYGQLQGREEMDLLAVFDGHGSRGEADFAAAYLPACMIHELEKAPDGDVHSSLCSAIRQTSNAMRAQGQGVTTGTTAVVAVLAESQLHVANVGDSNAVLSFADGAAKTLTTEHKPSLPSERARIEAMDGGLVTVSQRNGIARVQGQLAVSRALGDFHLEPYVTAEPSTVTVDLTSAEGNGPEYLILACDGVWDVYDAHGAAMEVRRAVHYAERKAEKSRAGYNDDSTAGAEHPQDENATMEYAAELLCDRSLNRGSTDNISVIVIDLRALGKEQHPNRNTRRLEPVPEPEPEPEPELVLEQEPEPTQTTLEMRSDEPTGPLKFSATSPAGRSPISGKQSGQLGVFSPNRLPYPMSGVHGNGAVEVGWRVTGGTPLTGGTPSDIPPTDSSGKSPVQSPGKSPTFVTGSRGGGGRRGAGPTNLLQGTDSSPLLAELCVAVDIAE